jgi:hypothetical protein
MDAGHVALDPDTFARHNFRHLQGAAQTCSIKAPAETTADRGRAADGK